MGVSAYYYFQTSQVVELITKAERSYIVSFQRGVEEFYRYVITKDEINLENSLLYIDKANEMSFVFSNADSLMQHMPRKEWEQHFYDVFKECYNYQIKLAGLMGDRIKFLNTINHHRMNECMTIAHNAYVKGMSIRKLISEYSEGRENFSQLQANLDLLHDSYLEFARAMNNLHDFIKQILITSLILLIIFLGLISVLISFLISKSIIKPLKELVRNFEMMALGESSSTISYASKNEIGDLSRAFFKIQLGFQDIVNYSKKVSQGDFSIKIEPKSEKDELSIALNQMASELESSSIKSQEQNWHNRGLVELNKKMGAGYEVDFLSGKILNFLTSYLNAQLGAIYVYDEEQRLLRLSSSYGISLQKLTKEIQIGDGTIGQVAKECRPITLNTGDKNLKITCASSEIIPQQILVLPLVYDKKLLGVLELASIEKFSDVKMDFVHEITERIAIRIGSSMSRSLLKDLLTRTQDQANELQVQQEELRVANEELEEQTQRLIENEKGLQIQQEELRVSNEELEERTNQLEIQKKEITDKNIELEDTRSNLEIKAQELESASRYKSEFLANMSHELRTPLNSLLILSKMLVENKKKNLFQDQVKSLKIINKSGNDLLQLINQILDLSKIEAGKMTVDLTNVRIDDIKTEILQGFQHVAHKKGVDFKVSICDNFPKIVHTDRQRVIQIIKNLLSNAFKFTGDGYVNVNFGLPEPGKDLQSAELHYDNAFYISVEDTGVGIPENKKEAIFSAFQQADGSISRKYGGTGLGLSISKEFLNLLGGEIHLKSEAGKGSIFTVYLPLNTPPQEELVNIYEHNTKNQRIEVTTAIQEEKRQEKKPKLPHFIDDDRALPDHAAMVLIIHPHEGQAKKLLKQCHKRKLKAVIGKSVQDGIILAEKLKPRAILISLDPKVHQDIEQLQNNEATNHIPVHVISPFDNDTPVGSSDKFKTLESMSFDSALDQLYKQLTPSHKFLIIEDDDNLRLLIHHLLANKNVSLKDAKSAEEAFQIIQKEKFDCIILDLGLPDYSGKELLARLKANNIHIPNTIIYTGKEISEEEHRELRKYTNSIVIKGIKSNERLMDEVTLFLHQVANTLPEEKTKNLTVPEDDSLFNGKRILVVDDDIRNTFALAQILEDKGIEVVEAENGLVAIDVLKTDKDIDLVLMDIMMPEMDGYQAMKEIRKTEEICEMPIITLTAKAMKDDYETAIRHGANDYITKPVDEKKLFSLLKIWLYN